MDKILILRFSSFGDVVQSLSIPSAIRQRFPKAEIHWLTREDFSELIEYHPEVKKVWSIPRRSGGLSLFKYAWSLRKQNFTHIYDAHNSQRSRLIGGILFLSTRLKRKNYLIRSMYRWKRFLLFNLRLNKYPQPFSGQRDLLEPLKAWGISEHPLPPAPQLFIPKNILTQMQARLQTDGLKNYLVFAASAAYPLKRWPLDSFKKLINQLAPWPVVLLGGREDHFLKELQAVAPDRVLNFAGELSLLESSAVVQLSQGLVSNDTGILHVGEQLGVRTVALMGPAPFGFPSRRNRTQILEKPLPCRPCSKHGQGPCINKNRQECLTSISPQEVIQALKKLGVLT